MNGALNNLLVLSLCIITNCMLLYIIVIVNIIIVVLYVSGTICHC